MLGQKRKMFSSASSMAAFTDLPERLVLPLPVDATASTAAGASSPDEVEAVSRTREDRRRVERAGIVISEGGGGVGGPA